MNRASIPRDRIHAPQTGLGSAVVGFMSVAAALGTSTIYLLQPSVAVVASTLGTSIGSLGIALSCGPIGYLAGLILLVPLVERYSAHRVMAAQFAVLAIALAGSATTGAVAMLCTFVAITGACSVVGAGMSSIAGRLAQPERRSTTLGMITSGISAGILAGRIGGGYLAEHFGWRAMLTMIAVACFAFAAGCWLLLPQTTSPRRATTWSTIRSIPALLVRHRTLRLAALRGALWFFAFCALWAGLAVALSGPPFNYTPERIGLYALAGLSGIAATQVAGRASDRIGTDPVMLVGLAIAGTAAVVVTFTLDSVPSTLICLALFDAGLFSAQVANQSRVLAIDPSAPARFNSGYMIVYFVGGSIGTAFGTVSVEWFGWRITALICAAAIALAAMLTFSDRQPHMG